MLQGLGRVAKLADAQASGACIRKDVGVQVPPRPPDRLAHQLRSYWTEAPLTTRTVPMHRRPCNQPTTRDRLMTRVRE